MATQTVTGKVQLRRDTASNWATENPTLLAGEMGVETDTLKCKIGDGNTAWNSLSYAFGGGGVYTLPTASANTLGGVKVGANLSIDNNGVLSATDTTYTITEGSTNGTISVDGTDVPVHGLGSNAYSNTSYLPLSGGTLTGNVIVSKSSPLISAKDTDITRNTAPSANIGHMHFQSLDSANNRLWGIYSQFGTNKSNRVDLLAYKGTTTDYSYNSIGVGFDGNGDAFTYAPTPATASNDTNIATTAFVKTNLADYLPLSGGTMTGDLSLSSISNRQTGDVVRISGGNDFLPSTGAMLTLFHKDATNSGWFRIFANNGTTTKTLEGKPDGTLTWGGTAISLAGHTHSYLPLSGGSMTGVIWRNGGYFCANSDTTTYLRFAGGSSASNGATLDLYGKDHSTMGGAFSLNTNDGSNLKALVGKPNGTLTWDGQAIQTSSDKRLKQDFSTIPNDVLEAWGKVEWQQFHYKADAERKGAENCRWHTGLVAQDVVEVGEENDVDLLKYGILCHDVAEAVEEEKDENGNVITEERDAVDLWTVRYEEALAMEVAYQRRRADRLEERIAKLEALLNV